MYTPSYYEEHRIEMLHDLMRKYPLATVITERNGELDVNHIPMIFDASVGEHGVLQCHVARANPVWKQMAEGAQCRVLFHGPQAYISPDWYPSKQNDPRVVPTWNFAVVHVHGKARVIEDPEWMMGLLDRLTGEHELNRPRPWSVMDAPPDYIDSMLSAIVGIEIRIEKLEAKFKLSQYLDDVDRGGVLGGLAAEFPAAAELARLMRGK